MPMPADAPAERVAHTPGPWRTGTHGTRGDLYWVVCRSDSVDDIFIHSDENGEADASLIAAAPDMYEALKAVHHWFDSGGFIPKVEGGQIGAIEYGPAITAVRKSVVDAIARAEGRDG